MWAKPRAAPPPSARPMRGRRGGGGWRRRGDDRAAATGGGWRGAGGGALPQPARPRPPAPQAASRRGAGAAHRRRLAAPPRPAGGEVHIPIRDSDPTNMCFTTGYAVAYSPASRRRANAFARPRPSHSGLRGPRTAEPPAHACTATPNSTASSCTSAPRSSATSSSATSPASCPTTTSGPLRLQNGWYVQRHAPMLRDRRALRRAELEAAARAGPHRPRVRRPRRRPVRRPRRRLRPLHDAAELPVQLDRPAPTPPT